MTRKPNKSRGKSPALSPSRKGRSGVTRRAPEKRDALDDVIAESAHSLGLKIDDAWKPAIRANLQVTLRHGALVSAFVLDDEAEPAPVFEP